MSEETRQVVDDYLISYQQEARAVSVHGAWLCERRHVYPPICTARIELDREGRVGPEAFCHSLRRTKATLIYRRTGNLRAVQLLLGHTKIESTVRYLGIEVDDALAIAEQLMSEIAGKRSSARPPESFCGIRRV